MSNEELDRLLEEEEDRMYRNKLHELAAAQSETMKAQARWEAIKAEIAGMVEPRPRRNQSKKGSK